MAVSDILLAGILVMLVLIYLQRSFVGGEAYRRVDRWRYERAKRKHE